MIVMLMWLGVTALGIYFMITGFQEMRQQMTAKKGIKKRKSAKVVDTAMTGVRDLVAEGRIAEAVDLYKAMTGADEYTAQEAIEAIQQDS
jgi:hypothetical protein